MAATAVLLPLAVSQTANAKYIIIANKGIQPLAVLAGKGREVLVAIDGVTSDAIRGQRTRTLVVVEQEITGAVAVGRQRSPVWIDDAERPEVVTNIVHTRATGRARFVEGWAIVTYFAEVIQNGKVIREWSRTEDVYLVLDDDHDDGFEDDEED